jgi:transposase
VIYIDNISKEPTAEQLKQEITELKAKLEAAQFALTNEEARRRDLEYRISQLLGEKYMPSSEKISIEQLELTLEGLSEAKSKPELTETPDKEKHYQSRKTEFPDDIPTEELKVEVAEAERTCPDTGKPRELVRLEESIKYEWVPGYFKKIIILREVRAAKYTDSDPIPCEPVVTAAMPPQFQVIPGCYAGVKLLVQVLVSKYCDHLPLYRQQEIFEKRHNVKIDRTLMGHWMKKLAISLTILYEALRQELIDSGYLQIDETFIKLIDPERKGKAQQAYFWVIRHPTRGVLFHFDHRRSGEVPLDMIPGYKGKLQSDGYSVYESLLMLRFRRNLTIGTFF